MRQRARRSFFGALRARRSGMVRVVLYTLLCCLLAVSWGVHRVQAMITEKALALGNEMLKLDVVDGEVNKMAINGEDFFISIATVDNGVDDVLDRFQKVCNAGHSALSEFWSSIPKISESTASQLAGAGLHPGSNSFRLGNDDSGVVLCFLEKQGAPIRTWVDTIRALADTGELGQLGALRYVFAKKMEQNTHLTILWSDSPLSLAKLTGADETRDVEGVDPVNIARPAAARRAFSASMPGTSYNFNLYLSSLEPQAILESYDEQMTKAGWTTMVRGRDEEPTRRVYVKPMIMVVAIAAKGEGGTAVSLLETSREEKVDFESVAPAARIVGE